VTTVHEGEIPAEVWGSTWIPGPSPLEGFGDATGYSIAWVRVIGGPMLQVLVDGVAAPEPGARGAVRSAPVDDGTIDVFTASNASAGGDR
jgi:hypothetical protein